MKPCGHEEPVLPPSGRREDVVPGHCMVCWLYEHDPEYRKLYDGMTAPRAKNPADCKHRGPQIGERSCETCQGHMRIKLFACPVHVDCSIARPLPGVACCATCPDFREG